MLSTYTFASTRKRKRHFAWRFQTILMFLVPGQQPPHPLVRFLAFFALSLPACFRGFDLGFCFLEYHTFGFLSFYLGVACFLFAFYRSLVFTFFFFSHSPFHPIFFLEVVLDISILAKFLPIANQYIKCKISISIQPFCSPYEKINKKRSKAR